MTRPVGDVSASTGRRLDAVLAAEQSQGRLPSLVAGVVRDGEMVWSGSHGSHTGGPPPGPDVQYRIGSITKTMTMVLVLQLRDEGRLDLNDPVGRYLPGVAYADRTVRSLLSHSSGMQSEPLGPWWERSPGGSFDELAAANDGATGPLPVGHQYHYSNLAFGLLGEVVARLRGEAWWAALRSRVLEPLGMARTSYHPEQPVAAGYSVHHFAGTVDDEPARDTGAMAPAGQVWSTVEDLGRYAAFLIEGHDDVLSMTTLLEASIPQSGSLAGGAAGGYGLGLRLLAGGSGLLVGHTGSMPGYLATLFVDRGRRTAALALANGTTGMRNEPLAVDLLRTLEDSEPTIVEEWTPTASVPDAVSDVLGVWHWGNTALAFSYDGREVVVRGLQTDAVSYRFALTPEGRLVGTVGYHLGETLEAHRDASGALSHLECATFVYTRTPYDPGAPVPGR